MKIHIKKSFLLFFFAILLVGSYTYVCHNEYHSTIPTTFQIKEEIKESTYQLPDIQALKHILGLIQKLIP